MNGPIVDVNGTFSDFSIRILEVQAPAYALWIFLCLANALLSMASISIFVSTKFKNNDDTKFLILNQLILELCNSGWSFGLAIWHLFHVLGGYPEATKPIQCYKYVAFQNFVIDGSSLFSFLLGLDRLLAIRYPAWYKYKSPNYKFMIVAWAYIIQSLMFILSFFDIFEQSFIPVCIVRAATGYYTTKFKSYYLFVLNVCPLIFYTVTYVILRHRTKSRIDSESNLSALKRKLNDKIMKALTFITTWHTLTFTLASFSTIILNKLPYRGAQYGPYFLAPYYTNGIACFLCYALYVSKFRECLKSLVDRGYLWMGRQDIPINVVKSPLNTSK